MDDQQLKQVAENRYHQPPPGPIGPIIRRLQGRSPLKVAAWRAAVAEVFDATGSEVLVRSISLTSLRAGVLAVNVEDATLLSMLRMQWHRKLLDLLNDQAPELGIVDIRFRLASGVGPEQKLGIRHDEKAGYIPYEA